MIVIQGLHLRIGEHTCHSSAARKCRISGDSESRMKMGKALVNAEESGADVNAQDDYGDTVLMVAAVNGRTEAVAALIKAGADVNAKERELDVTALLQAAVNGHSETVAALIKGGADVNAKNKKGLTPLKLASLGGRAEIIDMLKKAGAQE